MELYDPAGMQPICSWMCFRDYEGSDMITCHRDYEDSDMITCLTMKLNRYITKRDWARTLMSDKQKKGTEGMEGGGGTMLLLVSHPVQTQNIIWYAAPVYSLFIPTLQKINYWLV